MKNNTSHNNIYLYVLLATYFIAGVWLLSFLAWYTDSPDTIFYFTIAKKYASGNFYGAINNYWSPLISWLLIPFQLAHADPLLSVKTVQLICGAVAIIITHRLTSYFIQNRYLKNIFMVCLVPVILSYALIYQTPDLLFLTLLLCLVYHLINTYDRWFTIPGLTIATPAASLKQGVTAGSVGALLYFSKSFGFPYFIVLYTFFMAGCFLLMREKLVRKILLKNYAAGIFIFLIFSSCWIGLLHYKYGTISTGYASVYNFNLLAKEIYTPGVSELHHPVLENGLMNISSREEASAWESPGSSKIPTWSPFESSSNFKHYLAVIFYNWMSFYYFMISRNTGMIFLFTLALYFILIRKPFSKLSYSFFISAPAFLILVAGYSLVFFMPRYLWLCSILMTLMIIQFLEIIIIEKGRLRWMAYGIMAVTFFLLVKKPLKEILYMKDESKTASELWLDLTHPIITLQKSYQKSEQFPLLIQKLKALELENANVAGASQADPNHFSYTQSLLVCMYLNQPFFGELKQPITEPEKRMILGQFNIRYLYSWEPMSEKFTGGQKIFADPATGFTIFKIE